MARGGHIKLHRKMTEWGWYSDSNVKAVFLHLLFEANWKDSEYLGHKIERGQAVIGLTNLSQVLGMSVQEVRTALKKLEKTGEIKRFATNKFTVVTIENYNLYQCDDGSEQQTNNKRATNEQQTNNKRITNEQQTSNNIKKEKEEKEEIKEKEINKEKEKADISEFSLKMQQVITDWLTYKKERKEEYKPTGLKSWLNQVRKYCKAYDEKYVVEVIEKTMSCQYRGVVWDWLSEKPRKKKERADPVREIPPEEKIDPQEQAQRVKRMKERLGGIF